jgi:hypothetical protein
VNGSCPSCRLDLQSKPILVLLVQQYLEDHIVKGMSSDRHELYNARLKKHMILYKSTKSPWFNWVVHERIIEDYEDHVDRCGYCGFELIGTTCNSCQTEYPHHVQTHGESIDKLSSTESDCYDQSTGSLIDFIENESSPNSLFSDELKNHINKKNDRIKFKCL